MSAIRNLSVSSALRYPRFVSSHDFDRCFADVEAMELFKAVHASDARKYGKTVRACALSNREYQHRFNRFGQSNNMRPPPGSRFHIMPGYLVVRKRGQPSQYETWIPEGVFRELYLPDPDSDRT